MKSNLCIVLCVFALAGCSSATKTASPLIPAKSLQLTAGTAIKFSTLATAAAVGAAIYLVYDPLAPNWEIEESRISDDTYRMSLKMKRYHTGGAGESIQVLKRRASQLQLEQGYSGYQIVEYAEGIDSQTIGARRTAEGLVRLVQRPQHDVLGMSDRY